MNVFVVKSLRRMRFEIQLNSYWIINVFLSVYCAAAFSFLYAGLVHSKITPVFQQVFL